MTTAEAEAAWVAADDDLRAAERARVAHAARVAQLRAAGADELAVIAAEQEHIGYDVAVRDAWERRGMAEYAAFGRSA